MKLYGTKILKEIHLIWTDFDVRERAKQLGYSLNAIEVSNVLYCLRDKHDAEQGVSWTTLDYYIVEIVREREEQQEHPAECDDSISGCGDK